MGASRLDDRGPSSSLGCLLAGCLDAARSLADEGLRLAREPGERGDEAWALRLLGDVAC
jgi:hypothetical protein